VSFSCRMKRRWSRVLSESVPFGPFGYKTMPFLLLEINLRVSMGKPNATRGP
jgi:hypothetical protein